MQTGPIAGSLPLDDDVRLTYRVGGWLIAAGLLNATACTAPETNAPSALPIGRLSLPMPALAAEPTAPIAKLPQVPPIADSTKRLPIDLPTALALTNARPIDVITAAERVKVAAAQLEQARALWLPSVTVGFDYNRHDGKLQNVDGSVIDADRQSWMFGAGSGIGNAAIINVNDAIFGPLIARQTIRAREADFQSAQNDSLVAVTDAYFNVQQARGDLAGAAEAARRMADLVQRTKKLAPGLVADLEAVRTEAELLRRRQLEQLARERWRVTSAELVRLLRLDPATQVDPIEPPNLHVDLIDTARGLDELIPIALTARPELASRQAQVQATLTMLRQEKLRPLVPSILLRGWSTPVAGTLAAGVFGGGNGISSSTGLRGDIDLQLLWQFDNLGFGNRARTHQREAERRLAIAELFQIQDRIAAEVAQAFARSQEAARRMELAEQGVKLAVESADKNLAALGQIRRVGEVNQLLVRPQEVLAAMQTLAQAYTDYYAAVGDSNRAQFQLYRAVGRPSLNRADEAEPTTAKPAKAPVIARAPLPDSPAASTHVSGALP
ncbi:MAG TPA: TolC family protein [Urbifossiella sp.]|nr:TolC family protein [Urbifossiella sp.]